MPTPPIVKIGVWENERFIGCVLFSRGANNNLGKPYGIDDIQVCELTRVALDKHKTPVSKIISIALRLLKKEIEACVYAFHLPMRIKVIWGLFIKRGDGFTAGKHLVATSTKIKMAEFGINGKYQRLA